MNKMKVLLLTAVGSVVASSPVMAAIDVSAEATAFQTDFTAAAATIGSAFLAAGFAGIVWKWARGMLFS
ncbi:hypothetical protein [Rheinheimera sp. MMS21-TC3]|uniref:hypothetical protein n=1 Tax=Rheinheimera sp. MMS21-TC3 TaxID=3072790 RepID=UPI0028C421C8|nr:hypothetical protein [Rheinheimera sp. MMS21-TC3]WNO61089.1 hypothetical protein RDV63_09035 [Rheinheimera sp. MMS21-TC3]